MKHNLTALSMLTAALAAGFLAACGNGSSADGSNVTVSGDVPIVYAKRATSVRMNPTNGAPSAPGGDLILREKSSPSAPEHNITAAITQGKGDVVGSRGVVRRQEGGVRAANARPANTSTIDRSTCLPAPVAGTSGSTT